MYPIENIYYAPQGEYIKDHCLFLYKGVWHFFSISGTIGLNWTDPGSEESISHSTSSDLIHWVLQGHPVRASRRQGYGDEHMAVAPFVIRGPDERFYMFYSGWQHPNKKPNFSNKGHRQSIYIAVSDDLYEWRIPQSIALGGINVTNGEPIIGRDPHVLRDDENDRWLLYYTQEHMGKRPQSVGVAISNDLMNWRNLGAAFTWTGQRRCFDPCESPFILRHPRSGKYILLLNWEYAISDDPLHFEKAHALPFPAGLHYPPNAVVGSGEGWESVGVGFAREVIEFEGENYFSGVFGKDGEMKLGFTRFEWTDDFLQLAKPLT
jgi:hypothetical protein